MNKKRKKKKIMTGDLIPGRSDLSVTVFIPADCNNNCRFCTSKASYHQRISDPDAVIKSIKKFCEEDSLAKYVKSFVITGGEPLTDFDVLSKVLTAIPFHYDVYVNTIAPTNVYSEKKLAKFVNKSRIDALNISRHYATLKKDKAFYSDSIASDEFVTRLHKPVKINSCTSLDDDFLAKIKRWKKYDNVFLSLRADYRNITAADLKTLDEGIVNKILSIKHTKYISHGGCDVCFNVEFERKGFHFAYHRGLKHSSILFGNGKYLIVNDIIIHQDGEIAYDWI